MHKLPDFSFDEAFLIGQDLITFAWSRILEYPPEVEFDFGKLRADEVQQLADEITKWRQGFFERLQALDIKNSPGTWFLNKNSLSEKLSHMNEEQRVRLCYAGRRYFWALESTDKTEAQTLCEAGLVSISEESLETAKRLENTYARISKLPLSRWGA